MKWQLLDPLSASDAQALLAATRRRTFKRGEHVFHEGDPGDTLHLIDLGRFAVRVTTPMGEVATIRLHGPGSYFGELAVVSMQARMASVTALEAAETLSLHKSSFDRLRATHPSIDGLLVAALAAEVTRLSGQLLDALYLQAPERLLRCLVSLVDLYGTGPNSVTIPLTQDDLAGLCGTTRPTMNQLLQRLEDKQLVSLARGKLILNDVAALRSRADRI